MSVAITHGFVSAKGDDADPTLIQPSAWNAGHVIEVDGNSVIGNSTGSTGPATPISAGAAGLSVLAASSSSDLVAALAALGFSLPTTGDLKPTMKFTADTGWLMIDNTTIGNTASGATYANTAAQALYTFLWNNYSQPTSNAEFAVSGGLGVNATADWTAQKPMQLGASFLGRAMGVGSPSGVAGAGLTARTSGQTVGEENHLLTIPEIPSHAHTDLGHTHPQEGDTSLFRSGGSANLPTTNPIGAEGGTTGQGFANIQPTGGGGSHNNMQPTYFTNWMIKL